MKKRTIHPKPRSSSTPARTQEEELVAQWKQNANGAFRKLYLHFHALIFRMVLKIVHNTAVAEDVTQETFLRIHLHAHSFQEGTNFRAWILHISRNIALNMLRDKHLKRGYDSYDETYHSDRNHFTPSVHTDPHTALEHMECRHILEEGLEHLSPKFKKTILLYVWKEKSQDEIADDTHVPVGTVMSRLFRARQHLVEITRERLRDCLDRSNS